MSDDLLVRNAEHPIEFNRLLWKMLWAGELHAAPTAYVPPRRSRWERFRLWLSDTWWAHYPRFHFGPCREEGLDPWD